MEQHDRGTLAAAAASRQSDFGRRLNVLRGCCVLREEMGDEAIEALYRAQFGRFARLATALLGDREPARDAVNEAFARALRARRGLRREASLEAWLWRTVTNVCLDERRRRRPVPTGAAPAEANGHGGVEPWPELRAAVAALPERQRLTLFLRHYADLEYERIAEILGVDRGTVAASLHAAHAKLRAALAEAPR
jgi:RNA polymerase sigma-70 factor (ECF subfamily)